MKIAIIGPTNVQLISSVSGIKESIYLESAAKIGKLIAKYNHELIVVPDRGVAVACLDSYLANGGKKVIAISPSRGETVYQTETLKLNHHLHKCHEIITDLHWNDQHSYICNISDLMICCGISCGTICEISWTKWIEKPDVYICKNTITSIPPEVIAEAHIKFIESAADFEPVLQNK